MHEDVIFQLTEECEPGDILMQLSLADRRQEFSIATSEGRLYVSPQGEHTPEQVEAFVRGAVGHAIVWNKDAAA